MIILLLLLLSLLLMLSLLLLLLLLLLLFFIRGSRLSNPLGLLKSGLFVTVRAGTRTGTFFEEKKTNFLMYILKESLCVPASFWKCEIEIFCTHISKGDATKKRKTDS